MLVLQFTFDCKNQAVISQPEWLAGMQKVNARDAAALKARLPALCREVDGEPLKDSLAAFTKFWAYCYKSNLAGAQKQLALPTVRALAEALMKARGGRFPWAEKWLAFLDSRDAKTVVTRDTWSQLPDLGSKVRDPQLADFAAQAHWPVLFDDFNGAAPPPPPRRTPLPSFSHTHARANTHAFPPTRQSGSRPAAAAVVVAAAAAAPLTLSLRPRAR